MKKKLIINPALIYFSFLISITGHSQEFSVSLSKGNYADNIGELRKQFGINKSIPKEIELECLTALSFYPQLKNTHIIFKFGKTSSTMRSQPKLNSVFKANDKRVYQVTVKQPGNSKNGLEWTELSFTSLVGWIGHELAHILHYDHKTYGGILLTGIKYAFPKFRRRMERFTDQLAIKHDLGYALYEGTDYTLNFSNASHHYKKYLLKFYLSPDEIIKYINLERFYKINYRKTGIVDIESIVKAK